MAAQLYDSLEALNESASVCTACCLCQTRTNVVIYDGNPAAKLMIIGEGPGENEDLTGKPFVGRAGQLLDKIPAAVEINRQQETYICNVVKCRPPENRVPLESEVAQCIPYLESQIALIKPRFMLLLGATAVSHVLKIKSPKITQMHGKWIAGEGDLLGGIEIMPFYHPSYLLRQHSKEIGAPKWQAWQAIKEVKARMLAA